MMEVERSLINPLRQQQMTLKHHEATRMTEKNEITCRQWFTSISQEKQNGLNKKNISPLAK